ncbi:hypothetical protein GGF32_002209 [Allomyces javanicus]|nr:hypothetical protein GGF32_002209 [Allomyces javanicus]
MRGLPISSPNEARGLLAAWVAAIPLTTRAYLATVWLVFFVSLVAGAQTARLDTCLDPSRLNVIEWFFRALAAPLMHGGWIHILFNSVAVASLFAHFEKKTGTFAHAHLAIVVFPLVTAAIQTALYWVVMRFLGPECSVGASGVLFAFITAYSVQHGDVRHSIFGLVEVPGFAYPWALLVVIQVLFPMASLSTHLAGILAGLLYAKGWLDRIQFPTSLADRIETSDAWIARTFVAAPAYVPHDPATALPRYASVPTNGAPASTMPGGFAGTLAMDAGADALGRPSVDDLFRPGVLHEADPGVSLHIPPPKSPVFSVSSDPSESDAPPAEGRHLLI